MTQNPKQPNKRAPKIDLSAGPDLSDAALDQLADISQADIIAADALWKSKAPKPLKNLLDSKVIEAGQGDQQKTE